MGRKGDLAGLPKEQRPRRTVRGRCRWRREPCLRKGAGGHSRRNAILPQRPAGIGSLAARAGAAALGAQGSDIRKRAVSTMSNCPACLPSFFQSIKSQRFCLESLNINRFLSSSIPVEKMRAKMADIRTWHLLSDNRYTGTMAVSRPKRKQQKTGSNCPGTLDMAGHAGHETSTNLSQATSTRL